MVARATRSLPLLWILALSAGGCELVAGTKSRKVGTTVTPGTGGGLGTGGFVGIDGGSGAGGSAGRDGAVADATGGGPGSGGARGGDGALDSVGDTPVVVTEVGLGDLPGSGGVVATGGAAGGASGAGGTRTIDAALGGTGGSTAAADAADGPIGTGGAGTGGAGAGGTTTVDAGTGGSATGGSATGGSATGGAGAGGGGAGGATALDAATSSDTSLPTCPGVRVFDDFAGATLDPAKWSTVTTIPPHGNASVIQTGGHVEIANRGYLNSVGQFVPSAGGVRVTGKWTFAQAVEGDFLQVLTRSDGTPDNQFGEAQAGIECMATMASSAVAVGGWGTTVTNATSSGTFPINQGETLVFEMTDDGDLVTCAFVNVTSGLRATASGNSTFAPAINRVTFYNREYEITTHVSWADDLAIESGFVNRPIHHYLFEEASGPTAYDLPGTANGTLAAGASRVTAVLGTGITLAGTSDSYVDLGQVASALGTSDFTIAFWFKVPDTTRLMDLFGNRVDGSHGNFIGLRMLADGSVMFDLDQDITGTNWQEIAGGTGFDDAAWHHLAVRRQGLTLAMFIDGALVASDTRTTGTPTDLSAGSSLRLGSSAIAATYNLQTTGTFDDLRVYDRALGDCDVALIATRP